MSIYEKHKNTIQPRLAALLREKREMSGLVRKDVSEKLGVSSTMYIRMESPEGSCQIWQFVAAAEVIGFDAKEEIGKILSSTVPVLTTYLSLNKTTRLMNLLRRLSDEQVELLQSFLKSMLAAMVLLCFSLPAAAQETTPPQKTRGEVLWEQMLDDGWADIGGVGLFRAFAGEEANKAQNRCFNYVLEVGVKFVPEMSGLDLGVFFVFYNGSLYGAIPEIDKRGKMMIFRCLPNGQARFEIGVDVALIRNIMP